MRRNIQGVPAIPKEHIRPQTTPGFVSDHFANKKPQVPETITEVAQESSAALPPLRFRVLKNYKRQDFVIDNFRGKKRIFESKAGKTFDMQDEEQAALYHYWTLNYPNVICDVTSNFPNLNP